MVNVKQGTKTKRINTMPNTVSYVRGAFITHRIVGIIKVLQTMTPEKLSHIAKAQSTL